MDQQTILSILHEVGPRWAMLFGVGLWCWRVTPWAGKQIEKLVDVWVAKKSKPSYSAPKAGSDPPPLNSSIGFQVAKQL